MKKVLGVFLAMTVMTVLLAGSAYALDGRSQAQAVYTARSSTGLNDQTALNMQSIDVEALISAQSASLDSLVSQGVITRDYADAMLADYRAMLAYRAANSVYGGGFGGCGRGLGGFGGCGGYYQNR